MRPIQRRLALFFFICRKKHSTIFELASEFNVSERTIRRDLFEIETALKVPIYTQRGRYTGGVYILDTYDFHTQYINEDEMELLEMIYENYVSFLSFDKQQLFTQIMKKFSRL